MRRDLQERMALLQQPQGASTLTVIVCFQDSAAISCSGWEEGKMPALSTSMVDPAKGFTDWSRTFVYRRRIGQVAGNSQKIGALPHLFDRRVAIEARHRRAALQERLDAGLAMPDAAPVTTTTSPARPAARPPCAASPARDPSIRCRTDAARRPRASRRSLGAQDHVDRVVVELLDDRRLARAAPTAARPSFA